MKSDLAPLGHILESIDRIKAYTAGGREDFLARTLVQDAVVRNLEILGEATKRLSPELRARNPEIPWKEMAALRDVLAHGYMSVDLEIVWEVVERRLVGISSRVQSLRDELDAAGQ